MKEICPRCGTNLVRSLTPGRKVCYDCPDCGGRAITLPVLRAALGSQGVSALTCVALAPGPEGCICPSCGGLTRLEKVDVGDDAIEIDVCAHCLTVWCDEGEFERLTPDASAAPRRASTDIIAEASPEVQERYAKALLGLQPEEMSAGGFTVGEVLLDVVRVIAGVPTRWRTIRLQTPILALLLTMAVAVLHPVFFYLSGEIGHGLFVGHRVFWVCGENMVGTFGFDATAWETVFSFPFLQDSGGMALLAASLVLPRFLVAECKLGHWKFVKMLALFWGVAALGHVVSVALGWTSGALCGLAPIALGFSAFHLRVFPDLRLSWSWCERMPFSFYLWLTIPSFAFFEWAGGAGACQSSGLAPMAFCFLVGRWCAYREIKRQ